MVITMNINWLNFEIPVKKFVHCTAYTQDYNSVN